MRTLGLSFIGAFCVTLLGVASAQDAAPAHTQEPPASVVTEQRQLPEIDRLPNDHPHGGALRNVDSIDMIVIHTIGGPLCREGAIVFTSASGSAVQWRDWFDRQTNKSIHYVIDREGNIAAQRPEERTAGHVSYGGVVSRVNRRSIGIELVNRGNGVDPFPEPQILSLIALIQDIAARYELTGEALWTHAALDTRDQVCGGSTHRRNVDPGDLFPLDRVRAALPEKG